MSYSTNLGIELIDTGAQAGVWGNTTNTNLGTLIEQAISGYTTYACTGGTDTITIPDGATGVARNMFLELTTTGGGTLVVPAKRKLYFIYNNTASGAVTVKVSGQTGVSVPNGKKMVLVCNGTDVVLATNYMVGDILGNVTGNVTGNLTGNVTGNVSGSSGSCSGNAATATLAATATSAVGVSSGSWTITISGTKVYFAYGGVNKMSLDSSGNVVAVGNVTAYGTIT